MKAMKREITITRDEFNKAISIVAASSLTDEDFSDHPEAATLYSLGGIAFASKVGEYLFKEE